MGIGSTRYWIDLEQATFDPEQVAIRASYPMPDDDGGRIPTSGPTTR
jgi:hypothetical protein